MATYYSSSSNQRDVNPNLYLRDSAQNSYPETQGLSGNMMMYMNYSDSFAGNSQSQQNCVNLPSVGAQELGSTQQGLISNFIGSQTEEQGYSFWRDGRNDMFIQPTSIGGSVNGGQNLQSQGLSLTLSSHIPSATPVPSFQYSQSNPGLVSFLSSHPSISNGGGEGSGSRDDQGFGGDNHNLIRGEALNNLLSGVNPKSMNSDPSQYGGPGTVSAIANSKYLKVTQQLLDEVVNVHKSLKQHEGVLKASMEANEQPKDGGAAGMSSDPPELSTTSGGELSPSERQELQNRMTKLLTMLDEVDRRYKQYYHQMKIIVSSFDVIAGIGAAKPYTALAVQTISRHFRTLRDAINGQIRVTRRSLGEQDTGGNSKNGGISRLRFVDQQLRQQRAFQQFGMMQQHAWRPQRGLPESSVTILRAWLFEHFLHPYPKDSDKILLARQTGLTRSQVSNWFINARVRLWKPMVEEMYKEEFGETEMDSISSSENVLKTENSKAPDNRREELQELVKSATTERYPKSDFIPEVGAHEDNCRLLEDALAQSNESGNGRFMATNSAYQMTRYGSGSGVSLTLGLQHRDGGGLSTSGGTHQNFVMRADDMYNAAASASSLVGPETADYDCIDPGDRNQRFGSSHMLHDFVA